MRRRLTTLRAPVLALAALFGGCDPIEVAPLDAAPPGTTLAPPAPPAASRYACPEGHHAVELDGTQVCDPWDGARPRCAAGELLRAGGCEPIADDCGTDVPPEMGQPGVVLVRPESKGGDGSLARPFGTVREALDSGARTLALSAGEHAIGGGAVGATLIGTCPTRTTLRLDGSGSFTGESTLRRLRVTGAGGLVVPLGSALALDRVELDALSLAIDLDGTLHAQRTSFHDLTGPAIIAAGSVSLTLADVAFERIPSFAVLLDDEVGHAASMSLEDVMVIEVGESAMRTAILIDGVALDAARLVIEDCVGTGLAAIASTLSLEDVVLRRLGGAAITTLEDSGIALDRVWISEARAGLALFSGEHHLRDVVIADTAEIALAAIGASGDATRVDVRRAGITGVNIDGGTFAVSDVRVSGVRATTDDSGGAFFVEGGAVARLERALFEGTEHYGFAVSGATLDALDVEVRDVRASTGTDGYGVLSLSGAHLGLVRASIHDVAKVGLTVEDATATVEDLRIERVSAPDELDGVGIAIMGAGSATLARGAVVDTVRWGVIVSGPEALFEASDLEVRGVRAAPCRASFCRGFEGGSGIVAHDGSTVRVTRFSVRSCEMAGVVATAGVTVELRSGQIEDNPISLMTTAGAGDGVLLEDMEIEGDPQSIRGDVAPPEITF